MTADGFLGQLFVSIGVDTSGLANAATEMNAFQQKVITTSKMVNASTMQAANISDGRLKTSYNAETQYIQGKINANKQWDASQAKASRQYGSYIKQQITDSKTWEAHQQKWRGVESQYYAQEAAMKNKSLSAYNAAQRLGNTQQNQYWKQQSQEAAAAEKALARSTAGMGISLNSLSNNLYRFGTFATMAFTLPLAALATLGVKSAVELEQIKAKTVALANVSQEQMDAWSGAITRIGIATNATSKSIAQSLYFVSSAGVDNANAMKMVEFAAKGSAAGLGETDVIAKLLTYTYNAYGKEAFDVVKIMDSLTVAVREGAAEAGDIVAVMGDLIPIGAQLGVSFAQMAGSLAAMTQVGMNAHKSATALRQIMVQLIKPHHDAAQALDKAAIKMGDASIASRNLTATIRDKGLLETLVKIKEAGEKMGPMFLPTVFSNVRAFNGFMAEVGPNLDKVREIMKKTTTETGAFATALGIMTQTSEFKLGQFKKAWELAMLGLGQSILPKLLPMLNSLTQTINDLSSWFKSLSSTTQGLILDFGVFLAILGPFTIAASGLVRLWAILGMAMTGMIIPAIHGVGAALVWLSGVMLANPYIVMGVAIAALTYGIYSLATASKELTVAQKVLNDVHIKAAQSTAAEKVAIDQLMRVATSANATLDQKQKAIKTINLINPEYLEGINQETIRTGEATAAIGRYIQSLELKAKKQAAYDALVEVERKRAMALASGSDRELSIPQKIMVAFSEGASAQSGLGVGNKNDVANKVALENANKATKDYEDTIKRLSDLLNEVPLELQQIERASVNVAKAFSIFPKAGENILFSKDSFESAKEQYNELIDLRTWYLKEMSNPVENKKNWNFQQSDIDKLTKQIQEFEKEYQSLSENVSKSGVVYYTSSKYIDDLVGGMTKYNLLINNSKPEKKKDSLLPEDDKAREKAIAKILKDYEEGVNRITSKDKALKGVISTTGEYFDAYAEKVKLVTSTLDGLTEQNASEVPKFMKMWVGLNGVTGYTLTTFKEMDKSLNNIDAKIKQSGGSFTGVSEKIDTYKSALDKLAAGNISSGSTVDGLKQKIKDLFLVLIDQTLQKGLADSAISYSLLGNSYDFISAKTEVYKQQLQSLIQQYILAREQGDLWRIINLQASINLTSATLTTLSLESATKKYTDSLKKLVLLQSQLNAKTPTTNIESLNAQISVGQSYIDSLNDSLLLYQGTATDTTEIQKQLNAALSAQGALKYTERVATIEKTYNESIDKNDTKQASVGKKSIMSSPWKTDTENFRAYIQKLKDLKKADEEIGNTAGVLEWQNKLNKALNPTKFQAGLDKFNVYFSQIGQGINNILGEYVTMLDNKKSAAYDAIDSIAKMEGRSAEWIAKKKAQVDAEYSRNKKRAAIAEATINMFVGISAALKTPWMIPFITLVGLAQIANIKAAKMAMGGIVPGGYNNDTYPALLSSGETVIPASPHKLSSMLGSGNQTIRLQGEVVHRGKDLVYIINQEVKLMKSY